MSNWSGKFAITRPTSPQSETLTTGGTAGRAWFYHCNARRPPPNRENILSFIQVARAASLPGLVISNHPFFPNIDTQHLRATQRLDSTITNERLREALLIALASVNDDLREWRLEWLD